MQTIDNVIIIMKRVNHLSFLASAMLVKQNIADRIKAALENNDKTK